MYEKMLYSLVGREVFAQRGASVLKGILLSFAQMGYKGSRQFCVIGEAAHSNFSPEDVRTIIKDNTNKTITIVLGAGK